MKKLNSLKQNGYRITRPRQEILNALADHPLSVQELFAILKEKGSSVDLVSIYRTLELFTQMGLAQEIDLGEGMKRYELKNPNKHHHHLVCNNCGTLEDMTSKQEDILLKELQKQTMFKIQNHSFEVFGLCYKCQ